MYRSHGKLSINTRHSEFCCPSVFWLNIFKKSAADLLRLLSTTLTPLFRVFYTPPACLQQVFCLNHGRWGPLGMRTIVFCSTFHGISEIHNLNSLVFWWYRNKHQFCSKCTQPSLKAIYETHPHWKNIPLPEYKLLEEIYKTIATDFQNIFFSSFL